MFIIKQIRQIEYFKIFQCDNNYVVYNTHKPYHNGNIKGHTYVNTFKQAKRLVNLVLKRKIPYELNLYLIESLARLGEGSYEEKAWKLLENKKRKINSSKHHKRNLTILSE